MVTIRLTFAGLREAATSSSSSTAIAPERVELVLVDHVGVVEQPPDEGALAVVDAARREEAEDLLLPEPREVAVDVPRDALSLAHQKYPSRFLVSIEPSASWSMTRVVRSERRVSSSSAMMSSTVFASERTAPVQG